MKKIEELKMRLLKLAAYLSYIAAIVAVSGVSRRGTMQPKESDQLRSKSLF